VTPNEKEYKNLREQNLDTVLEYQNSPLVIWLHA